MADLEGKTVLVTGGGGGIGRAIARAFAAHRAEVVVTGRTRSTLEEVAGEIRSRGGKALPFRCDVTRKEEVEALEHEITSRIGIVQVLVNNAGIAPAAGFLEMEDRLWEEVLRVNLIGAYNCCKVFLPAMIASGWGRIINIASTVAKTSYPNISAYAASKHALLGLTRSLAVEVARSGVTVNAVCPGYVDTELTRRNAAALAARTGRSIDQAIGLLESACPQKRLIAPEEVAFLAVVLASEDAKGITGQAIHVDGGAVMA